MPATATAAHKAGVSAQRNAVVSRAAEKSAPAQKQESSSRATALPAFMRPAMAKVAQAPTPQVISRPVLIAPKNVAAKAVGSKVASSVPVGPKVTPGAQVQKVAPILAPPNIVVAPKAPASIPATLKAATQAPAAPSVPKSLSPVAERVKPRPKLVPLAPSKGAGMGPGQPIPSHVQEAIQNSLMVDLSSVRLHASTAAERKAQSLSARAFTFGNDIFLGRGEHPTDLTLISHEAAHVIQQQHAGPAVQAWTSDRSDPYEREADRAAIAVQRSEPFAVTQRVSSPRVQRLGISDALDYLADKAYNIPGFRMFTIVLGINPINMEHVPRNAANVLRAVVEFIPGGSLISQALDKYGVFDKVGNWVSEQIEKLGIIGSSIKNALMDFLDSLSWRDIFHLGDVWDRAKRIFTDPIDKIIDFVKGLVEGIWKFVREAILKPIAKLAEGTAGWDLLIAVMGKNPITGEAVPQTPENLIGGFMKLIHEEEIWNNLKKANAVARAFAWFKGVLTGLLGFVSQIPGLFIKALKSLEWSDILDLPGGFMKIVGVFGKFLGNFISWAGGKIWDLLQIIFDVVAPSIMPYLRKVGAAFKKILKDPIGFVRHLVAAAKLGLGNFSDRFGAHLKAGLIDWLTGSLPGVYIPKEMSLPEMGKFALSVLGITWGQIRAKIVKALGPNGEKIMTGLETAFDVVVALIQGGPAAAWELIKEKLTNLKDMVVDGIISFVVDTIIKKAIPKLISMFIPGAGFISAIMSMYDTVMVFVQKLAKIAAAVKAFVDSIVNIANGQIDGAAAKVESGLAGLLSLAISFLAGFLGLGNVASKILAVIKKVQDIVDKALDTAINWIVGKAKALFAKLFGKKDKDDKTIDPDVKRRWDQGTSAAKAAVTKATNPETDKPKLDGELDQIRSKYQFKVLSATHTGKVWKIHALLNPEEIIEVEDEAEAKVDFIVIRVDAETVTVKLDPEGDEIKLKQRMSGLKKEEELMKLEISRETAKNFLKKLGGDWKTGQLLMQYARTEAAGMLPKDFLLNQISEQRATSAAVARPVTAETRSRLVNLGDDKKPLSNVALVFREESPGQFEVRDHPEAKMKEYIYHGAGSPKVIPLAVVETDEHGVVVKINFVSRRVEGGQAAFIELMRKAGWKVELA